MWLLLKTEWLSSFKNPLSAMSKHSWRERIKKLNSDVYTIYLARVHLEKAELQDKRQTKKVLKKNN
jgi:hypothetical protein